MTGPAVKVLAGKRCGNVAMLAAMDLGIEGRSALVTGAGRGLGASIAVRLALEGVRVLAVTRGQQSLEELLERLDPSQDHEGFVADLSSRSEVNAMLGWADSKPSGIDIVINNVGGNLGVVDPLASDSEYMKVLNLNLGVAIEVNRALIPAMQRQRWGRICHVSSIAALENQGAPAYCASKAALNAYVRSLGRFLCAENVILTGIMPGAVLTEGGYWDEARRDRPEHVEMFLRDRMAIGRFGTEAEIADAVAFLVSDNASFLVGSMLLADGGQGRVFQG